MKKNLNNYIPHRSIDLSTLVMKDTTSFCLLRCDLPSLSLREGGSINKSALSCPKLVRSFSSSHSLLSYPKYNHNTKHNLNNCNSLLSKILSFWDKIFTFKNLVKVIMIFCVGFASRWFTNEFWDVNLSTNYLHSVSISFFFF